MAILSLPATQLQNVTLPADHHRWRLHTERLNPNSHFFCELQSQDVLALFSGRVLACACVCVRVHGLPLFPLHRCCA